MLNKNTGYGQGILGNAPFTTGKIFVVAGSSNANVNDIDALFTPDFAGVARRYSTIASAVGACVSGRRDIILVASGHTESVTAAAGIALTASGVSIVGLGQGEQRPRITFSTATTADFDIGASNTTFENIIFVNDIDSLAEPLDIAASITDIVFKNCEFRDETAAKQTIRWFQTADTNSRVSLIGCRNVGSDTAGATAAFTFIGGSNHFIDGFISNGNFSAANIEIKTTLTADIVIKNCLLENSNAVAVNIEGNSLSNTGWIANNFCRIPTDGATTWINATGNTQLFENYGVNNNGETGKLIGTASV